MVDKMRGSMFRTLRRSARIATILTLLITACCLLPGERAFSQAQAPSISPDLMQMFQSLPPDQQEAILKQFGLGGAGGILGAPGGGGSSSAAQAAAQSRKRGSGENTDETGGEEDSTAEPPGLKGEDWVIVLADFPGAKNAPGGAAATAPSPSPAVPAAPSLPGGLGGASSANSPQAQIASLIAASSAAPPAAPATSAAVDPEVEKERQRLQPLIDLIRAKNPYRLSREGALTLPGFAPIALLGLTDEQATPHLSAEPALLG